MVEYSNIRIIGAGAMGRGIAQSAVAAGFPVQLCDAVPEAVPAALEFVARMLRRTAEKGLRTSAEAEAAIARLSVGPEPHAASTEVDLVIEAVREDLAIKQALFAQLDAALPNATLASNTSSLSITAIAAVVADPSRVLGLHFFNPVPLMRLVEIVPGMRTDPSRIDAGMGFVRALGHTPVLAKDNPGFLVNLLGRGLPTEALSIHTEDIANVADLDRIARDTIGLKMGPFELMDLTGLDISHPVLESVWRGFYCDERLRPSLSTGIRTTAGLLGRKSGEGFYTYVDGAQQVAPEPQLEQDATAIAIHVVGGGPLTELLVNASIRVVGSPGPGVISVVQPLGRPAYLAAIEHGLDASRTIGVDPLSVETKRLTVIAPVPVDVELGRAAIRALAATGKAITVTADGPAPVAQRIIASMVNVASSAAQDGLGTPADIDLGAELGLGYPQGPLSLGDTLGPSTILAILDGLLDYTGDSRYRASGWLRTRADLGLSLLYAGTRPAALT
ncbi:3-hydroxyacyl-CoA dehydrogenase NAD-binding domain-containing protein [Tomitella biformata]|uniref:3-hydroxyacyl-CoA dehydrogenase NAD-binding domain-containing protein n=1 Tax=Tomitella biformata TaxID=630403 RepID=UPI0004631722|nr:3-hydroxyacyl-CoA dehydrogenase NAD-binding domain-containing protein [Tomitella biformata]